MKNDVMVLLKPDAVRRGLVGQILARFEAKGFEIVKMRVFAFTFEMVRAHYREHVDKVFYDDLRNFMLSGPCVAVVLYGPNAVGVARSMAGATGDNLALPGTIRGDYASGSPIRENLVHVSDSCKAAEREIKLFFPEA